MKILIALASDAEAAPFADALEHRDWTVVRDAGGRDADMLVEGGGFDAALLDPALPEARRTIERLRAAEPELAVILLGAELPLALKARLFDAGADDVLARPIAPAEIDIRARAIARRRLGHTRPEIRFGDLVVVPGSHASVDGRRLPLRRSQLLVLEALAKRAGRVVTREALLGALYGGRDEPNIKILDVFVCNLRRALTARGVPPTLIGTVWGLGWILPEPYGAGLPMPSHGAECRRIVRDAGPRRYLAGAAA